MAVEYDPALINKVFEVTEPVEVKAEKIARYCAALGETNPIYTDEEAAKKGAVRRNRRAAVVRGDVSQWAAFF